MYVRKLRKGLLHKKTLLTPFGHFFKPSAFSKLKQQQHHTLTFKSKIRMAVITALCRQESNSYYGLFSDNDTISLRPYAEKTYYYRNLLARQSRLKMRKYVKKHLFKREMKRGDYVHAMHTLRNLVYRAAYSAMTGLCIYKPSSGLYLTIDWTDKERGIVAFLLPSGLVKKYNTLVVALLGRNVGVFYLQRYYGLYGTKAKRLHKKQSVRGVAMNPVDHPNGGNTKAKTPFFNKYNRLAKKGK